VVQVGLVTQVVELLDDGIRGTTGDYLERRLWGIELLECVGYAVMEGMCLSGRSRDEYGAWDEGGVACGKWRASGETAQVC